MKKILIILFMAGAAFLVYRWYWAGTYGISAGHPLGKFHVLDRHLTEMKLQKQPPKQVSLGEATATATAYVDVEASRLSGFNEVIMILVDDVGVVRGVEGRFGFKRDNADPFGYTPVPTFMMGLWHDVGGGKPEFKYQQSGTGVFAKRWEEAKFDNGVVEGTWTKEEPFESIRILATE